MGAGNNPNTGDLPICFATAPHYSEGKMVPFIISRWKLSPEELKTVQETGEIWISIMGAGMPPIMPLAEDPFGPVHNFKPLEI